MDFNSLTEKIIFFKVPTILFSLLPFFLITGPFLSDLSVSLISVLFLIYCYKNKNFTFFKNKFFYIFLIFWFYLIFNSIINNTNFDSLKISIFYFRYGVFIIAIVALLNFDKNFLKYFLYCIITCFLILIIDGFFQYFNPNETNILGFSSSSYGRVSSFFGKELILGSYIVRLWPILFGLTIIFFNQKKNKFYLFIILLFILSEVLIFLSGERAAFFYINLSAIFIILMSNKILKLRIITLILSLLILIFISFLNPSAKQRMIDMTFNQMKLFSNKSPDNKNEDNDKIIIFSEKHTEHYISAYKMFLDNKVLGVGVKNFRNFCSKDKYYSEYSCSTHPHNIYIQILAETGLIGFSFLILIFLYFCKYSLIQMFKKITKKEYYFSDFEICLLSGILIYLWPFVPTGNVFNNWLNITIILNIPLLIWSKKYKKR